jgi:hypothetical protein
MLMKRTREERKICCWACSRSTGAKDVDADMGVPITRMAARLIQSLHWKTQIPGTKQRSSSGSGGGGGGSRVQEEEEFTTG